MPNLLAEAGLNVAQNVVNTGMGLLLGKHNDKRQLKQQTKLQDLQIKGNKEMADYNYNLQKRMWEETNYSAQMEQLEKAGLNPGLVYGQSGGGATTTGSQGGNVTGAEAPKGGGEAIAMMGMGMNLQMMKAEIELKQAQARNLEAVTDKTKGVDTEEAQTRILDLTQGIANKKAQEALTRVQTRLGELEEKLQSETMEEQIATIDWEAQVALQELDRITRQNGIDQATKENKIKQVQADLLQTWAQTALTKQQTTSTARLTEQQIRESAAKIAQGWENMQTTAAGQVAEQRSKEHNMWVNDVAESLKIPADVVEKIIQAITVKDIMKK